MTRRSHSSSRRVRAPMLAVWLVLLSMGCAGRQVIPLDVEPAPVEVYVDGKRMGGGQPESLELTVDRGHVVLIRRAGYRPQQVVLESVEWAGERRLSPERIQVRLTPEQSQGQSLSVELEENASDEGSPAPASDEIAPHEEGEATQ